jgi:hypothetical protein
MSELEHVQRWMQALITDAGGVKSALQSADAGTILPFAANKLDDLVMSSQQLSAVARLEIYGNMYFARLMDVMTEEFPTVRELLGDAAFRKTVTDFLTRHPPTHYSLTRLGSRFPEYLANKEIDIPARDFVADVATVDRAMEDVFDARHVEPIRFDELQQVPLSRWGDVRLLTVPALRLLALNYPVNDCITAVRERRHMEIPAPSRACVAVYRHNYRVWRVTLDVQRFDLLAALQRGETLGAALELCSELPGLDPAGLVEAVGGWFREWASEGLFVGVQIDS